MFESSPMEVANALKYWIKFSAQVYAQVIKTPKTFQPTRISWTFNFYEWPNCQLGITVASEILTHDLTVFYGWHSVF